VYQIVFMRLHEHLDTLSQPERVRAWLVTVARRETLRRLEERQRTVSLDVGGDDDEERERQDPVDPDPLPDATLETLQLHQRARQALARLGEPCRGLLQLLYMHDEPPSYQDIAQQLRMAVGSIGPTRARCLGRLRTLMEALP
jgi:RNA polymerase sigma factor (sigma-70 family)